MEARPGQCLYRNAARAGTAADRFQVSLSPALGLAKRPRRGTHGGGRRGFKRRPTGTGPERQVPVEELYPHDLGGEDRQQLSQFQGACDVLAEDNACHTAATMAGTMRDPC